MFINIKSWFIRYVNRPSVHSGSSTDSEVAVRVVFPGGSGQVGTIVASAFHRAGHDVVVLSRRPKTCAWRVVEWDGATPGAWQREIDGADVVVNLAGRSVNCRYNAANRHEILQSRIASTRAVVNLASPHPLPNAEFMRMLREAYGV